MASTETRPAEAEQVEDPALERVERAEVPGGLEIAYESFGDPDNPTVLLVMGLGMQMLGWDEEFCEQVAERGFRVVRFDNRDVGLSSKVGGGAPNVLAGAVGIRKADYALADMAIDAVGLLDHLEVDGAHLVGASMGGMIAQTIAARHPERALSLCSIMSGPGGRRRATMPRMSVMGTLLSRPPREREAYAGHVAGIFERIGSPGFSHDRERLRRRALISYDRCFHPAGAARQLMAIMASGNRSSEIARITCPTLVIHGREDKLLPSAGGEATAQAIAGARLELIDGMGHDLPIELWPRFADLIAENAARAKPELFARALQLGASRSGDGGLLERAELHGSRNGREPRLRRPVLGQEQRHLLRAQLADRRARRVGEAADEQGLRGAIGEPQEVAARLELHAHLPAGGADLATSRAALDAQGLSRDREEPERPGEDEVGVAASRLRLPSHILERQAELSDVVREPGQQACRHRDPIRTAGGDVARREARVGRGAGELEHRQLRTDLVGLLGEVRRSIHQAGSVGDQADGEDDRQRKPRRTAEFDSPQRLHRDQQQHQRAEEQVARGLGLSVRRLRHGDPEPEGAGHRHVGPKPRRSPPPPDRAHEQAGSEDDRSDEEDRAEDAPAEVGRGADEGGQCSRRRLDDEGGRAAEVGRFGDSLVELLGPGPPADPEPDRDRRDPALPESPRRQQVDEDARRRRSRRRCARGSIRRAAHRRRRVAIARPRAAPRGRRRSRA